MIVLEEFADVDTFNGGLRFGSFCREESLARNVRIGPHSYDVRIGPVLEVHRDGELLLRSTGRAVVSGYQMKDGQLRFNVHAAEDCELEVFEAGVSARTVAVARGKRAVVCR